MASLLSWLLGGGDDPTTDAMERTLARAGHVHPLAEKAGPPAVVGRTVQNDAAEAFLRGMDFFGGGKRGLANPYAASGWVQQAIKLVTNPILAVPLRFAAVTDKGTTPVHDPQLAAFWQAPAVGPEGPIVLPDVLAATVGWMKLQGEAFWIVDDSWLTMRAGARNPFFIARPDQMFEVMGPPTPEAPFGELIGWRYRDARGRDWPLVAEQVYHPKFWNPYHPVRGLGEFQAAALAAQGDIAAAEFGKNIMESNGDRGPIVSVKNAKELSREQQQQIEAAIKEKMAQVRAGGLPKPMFLTGDVAVAQPAIQSADAAFVANRVENRKEIYIILGVPSSFAEQMHRATTAHESDRFILVEQTCIPLASTLAATIARMARNMKALRGSAAAKLTAFFDWDEHSIFLQVRTERVDAWDKLCNRGMPPAAAGQYLGMRLPEFEGDDVGFVPTTVQPLEKALEPTSTPTPPATPALPPAPPPAPEGGDTDNPPGDGEPEEKTLGAMLAILALEPPPALGTPRGMLAILDAPAATVPPVPALEPPTPTPATLARAKADTSRGRLWENHAKVRAPAERRFRAVAKNALWNARGQMLAKLERTKAAPDLAKKDDDKQAEIAPPELPHPGTAVDVMFDPVTFALELTTNAEAVARETMQRAGVEVRAELGADDPWTMESADVINALRNRTNLLRETSQDVWEEVKAHLEEGFQTGETTAQLETRVRSTFNDLRASRAKTIAVTETGAAYGGGREAGAKSIGYKTKSWLSSRDSHVRPTHTAADGQTVDARGVFKVGADLAPYPCAEGMSAKEACNCRCVCLYHI